jgi:hypothetical protein
MEMRANLPFAADQSSRNDRIANTVTQVPASQERTLGADEGLWF